MCFVFSLYIPRIRVNVTVRSYHIVDVNIYEMYILVWLNSISRIVHYLHDNIYGPYQILFYSTIKNYIKQILIVCVL